MSGESWSYIPNRTNYQYVNARGNRTFASKSDRRERFLDIVIKEVEEEGNVDKLIRQVSEFTFFKARTFLAKARCLCWEKDTKKWLLLSLINPLLVGLSRYKIHDNTPPSRFETRCYTFNNPLYTALVHKHISMKSTIKKVTLLLMRLHTIQLVGSSGAKKADASLFKIIAKLPNPQEMTKYLTLEQVLKMHDAIIKVMI